MLKILSMLLLLSPLAFAEKNEMVPLRQYIENQDNNIDLESLMYVNLRCIALHQWIYSLMQVRADMEPEKEAIKIVKENLTKLIDTAEVMYNSLIPENEHDFSNFIEVEIIPMMENYQMESQRSWTNTGEYFNNYINDEIDICKRVANT